MYLFLSTPSSKCQPLQQILQFSRTVTVEGTFSFNKISKMSQKLISPFHLCFFFLMVAVPSHFYHDPFFLPPLLYFCVNLTFPFPLSCSSSLSLSVSHSGAGTCSRNMMDDHLSQLVYYNSDNQLHIPNAGCPAGNLHAQHRPMWKWNLICQMSFRGYSMMITVWLFQQLCVSDNIITYCLPQVTLL